MTAHEYRRETVALSDEGQARIEAIEAEGWRLAGLVGKDEHGRKATTVQCVFLRPVRREVRS